MQALYHCNVMFKLVFAIVSLELKVLSVTLVEINTTDFHQMAAGIIE